MGLTNFQIVLDSPTGAYYAGTNVIGKLQFTLDKPKKIRGDYELPNKENLFKLTLSNRLSFSTVA